MSVATLQPVTRKTVTAVKKTKDDFDNFPDITDWSNDRFMTVMIDRIMDDPELRPFIKWDDTLVTENKLVMVF
jgi:hypothetical protein